MLTRCICHLIEAFEKVYYGFRDEVPGGDFGNVLGLGWHGGDVKGGEGRPWWRGLQVIEGSGGVYMTVECWKGK